MQEEAIEGKRVSVLDTWRYSGRYDLTKIWWREAILMGD